MSITDTQRVNNLRRAVNYMTRNDKTDSHLIHSHNCTAETITKDFNGVLDQYNESNNRNRTLKPRMIIQSFSPEEDITLEKAHEYMKEFAEGFLENKYQYIIATHKDTKHIHNHLIFNDISYSDLKVFDSSKKNSIYRMRHENDKVAEKYGVKVIEKSKGKSLHLSHKEYVVRSRGDSFKSKLEGDIDSSINEAFSYQDFLDSMKRKGYEYKQGKYLAFKSSSGKKFIRTKSMGFNYLENSIKYRIDNKDYVPFKTEVIKKEWIDKSELKFKENKGLHKWATIQNINYLHEVNSILSKENITLSQFLEKQKIKMEFEKNLEDKLTKLDNQILKIKSMEGCYDTYKNSHKLIVDYKKIKSQEGKDRYKRNHFSEFKMYDIAKKNINILKKFYRINNKSEVHKKIKNLESERNLIYESLNLNKDIRKNKQKDMEI